jgi:(1->4)-alpha-D-glucan 1-alpha-D-glucosylmutase
VTALSPTPGPTPSTGPRGRVPVSTYRLQIRESFTLQQAADLVDYVRDLGADWVYTSPLLEAEAGSDHGYDVVDHGRVDPVRGGRAGLERLAATAHDAGLGVLVDIVPNHIGVADASGSAWWWDLLRHGRDSRIAEAFDVDWDAGGGRIRIPVLGETDDPPLTLETREIRGESQTVLAYYDNVYPVARGTADDGAAAATVAARQHYELVHWTEADAGLNYRRFFAVNTLAAIRVEVPWVFDESHAEIGSWFRDGLVDGLRVDHPDGVRDPGGYLDRLAELTGGAYVLVEKILEHGEAMPPHWQTDGTTGYDALAEIERVFVDPAGEAPLTALDHSARTDGARTWSELVHGTKSGIANGILRSEAKRITRELLAAASDTLGDDDAPIEQAVQSLLAAMPVYRSYLPFGREHLDAAVADAGADQGLAPMVHAVAAVLADPDAEPAKRFQQTSGMVMAKGVEDTAFYRWSVLPSLTEVGGDPSEFALDASGFHAVQVARQASWPAAMTTLSTHDTKRGEDVRARIDVLAETPDEWAAELGELAGLAPLGDAVLEHLLWATIVGCWPASRERLHAYAEKASREAGTSTTWTAANEAFETRMHAMVDAAFDEPAVAAVLDRIVGRLRDPGWSNSLGIKLVQLTAPGVPDVYQGSELWETSLVDPDNRRPVDFAERRALLARLDDGWLPPVDETGAAKLLVTSQALRLRRDRPELFTRYVGLATFGAAAEHAVAFDRGGAVTVATRLPVGLERAGGWGDTTVLLPGRAYVDVLTGTRFTGGAVPLATLLATYPVALLAEETA